jgi:hypothetical protein
MSGGRFLSYRSEQRNPGLTGLLEGNGDGHTDVHIVDLAFDDVGRESQTGLLVELNDGHDVWKRYPRIERVVVDSKGEDLPPAAYRSGYELAVATGAFPRGRVNPPLARFTPQDEQASFGAACPEGPTDIGDGRGHAKDRFISHFDIVGGFSATLSDHDDLWQ